MATVKHAIREHDVVRLLDPVDRVEAGGKWPAGTIGTVVDERGESKLIEIADERGVALDYVVAPAAWLALVTEHSA